MGKKILSLLALLLMAVSGAWGMQIYISYPAWPSGTSVNSDGNLVLEVEPSDSFENLKAKIEDKTGFDPTYMHLFNNSIECEDDETLSQKGISANSVLTLVYDLKTVKFADGTEDATNWTITPAEATTTGVAAGTEVKATYSGTKRVKSVKAVKKAPAGPPSLKLTLSSPAKDLYITANGGLIAQHTLDVASTEFTVEMPELTSQTVNIVATDGSGNCWYCTQENMSFAFGQTYQSSPTMTALDEDNTKDAYKITGTVSTQNIPDGKTVVLSGVTISNGQIACSGNATIILMGTNSVTGASYQAAIKIGGSGTTLTITGSGSLTATGGMYGAGIGTEQNGSGGNIVINGGTVTATGGSGAAGIGTGMAAFSMSSSNASNTCGAITIGTGVTKVTATKGSSAPNSIGKGNAGMGASQACGTITIGGDATTYAAGVTESPFIYPAP